MVYICKKKVIFLQELNTYVILIQNIGQHHIVCFLTC